MKNIFNKLILFLTISFLMISCHDELDQAPIDPDSFTEQDVFANANAAKSALAKLYASLALTGQQGPSGLPDIADIDEGFSQFSRMLFNLNELTTDHAVVGWGDPGLPDLHGLYWSASNDFTGAMYLRLAQEVSFCNAYIQNASAIQDDEVQTYIAEARFLRAFAYYNLIDLYANVPLLTEISTELPVQSTRTEVFNFIESELKEIQDLLVESGANEYGRVDKVAAWALLSRLYLNAEVWRITEFVPDEDKGKTGWQLCVEYSSKVINSSYIINTIDVNGNGSAYDELFLADNNTNGAQNEFIFALNFDGIQSQTWGGSTFLVHASIGGTMKPAEFGVNGGWGGIRTTKSLVEKFNVDTEALSETLGTASSWGIVGGAAPNGWDGPDVVMYETATNKYEVIATLGNGEIKFRENNTWSGDFGDATGDGILDHDPDNNISVTAGNYKIIVDFNNLSYSITPFAGDTRGMFHSDGQNLEIGKIPPFKEGYAITKFKNVDSNGNPGHDAGGNYVDTDIPLIRLAEIYLNYAEATVQGGGGDFELAKDKINDLRKRAYGNSAIGNIDIPDITLDFILDERSRELYWEGQRRTDLVRYNYFTTNAYLWPFKGNQPNGISTSSNRNIFPIPSNTIATNPNLKQNEGY